MRSVSAPATPRGPRVVASPAKLAEVAAVAEHAVHNKENQLGAAIHNGDNVMAFLCLQSNTRSESQRLSECPSLSTSSTVWCSVICMQNPRPSSARLSSKICPHSRIQPDPEIHGEARTQILKAMIGPGGAASDKDGQIWSLDGTLQRLHPSI